MPTVRYHRFEQRMIDTIKEALHFLKSRIRQYGENKKKNVDDFYHPVIDSEIEKEIDKIEELYYFLDVEAKRFVIEMEESVFQGHMDVIRSALEIYLRETKSAKSKSSLIGTEFDSKIQEITRVLSTKAVKTGRADLYDKYGESVRSRERVEVFLSYSHNDRALAGKLAAFLREREIDVFLAHENIEISKEWRNEIFKHLRSCDVLLALLTPDFEGSVWTNQEAGYILGRMEKVVPLIVGETDIKRFGFLEAFQGILIKEKSPEQSFKEILNTIVRHTTPH